MIRERSYGALTQVGCDHCWYGAEELLHHSLRQGKLATLQIYASINSRDCNQRVHYLQGQTNSINLPTICKDRSTQSNCPLFARTNQLNQIAHYLQGQINSIKLPTICRDRSTLSNCPLFARTNQLNQTAHYLQGQINSIKLPTICKDKLTQSNCPLFAKTE